MSQEITLDVEQRMAVDSSAPAVVVVAGAGSGKTEVVARRVERILRETPAEAFRILALSYTVRAAEELRSRFRERLGNAHRRVDTDTVHGFALSLIRQFGTRIGLPPEPEILTRDEDRAELLLSWLAESQYPEPGEPISEVLARLDTARARGEPTRLLAEWREALDARGALDFPAMLDKARDLLIESSWVERHVQRLYEHVIIDEAQNLTPAQYEFLRLVVGDPSGSHVSLMIVGDERQSIVTFAGADPRLISRLGRDYGAKRIELLRNYRSAEMIVRLGKTVATALELPSSFGDTDYAARGSVSLKEVADEVAESAAVSAWIRSLLSDGLDMSVLAPGEPPRIRPEDIAVLSRSGATLRLTRESLEEWGIESSFASTEDDWVRSTPGRMVVELSAFKGAPEHRSTQRRLESLLDLERWDWSRPEAAFAESEHSDLVVLLQASSPQELVEFASDIQSDEPDWPDDLVQIRDALDSFLAHTDVAARTFSNFRQHIVRCQRGDGLSSGVRLLTVHKAQGREFRAVAVVGCNDGQFPDFRARGEEERRSELRTFYVAVTRPTRALLLTRARTRRTQYGPRSTEPSPFLKFVDAL